MEIEIREVVDYEGEAQLDGRIKELSKMIKMLHILFEVVVTKVYHVWTFAKI